MSRCIVVVGGGVAGLAAAHRLTELSREKNLGLEIVLLEARLRLGGSILTERVGDFLVEAGPDSFITEKPWALRLCERLGVASRLISTNPRHQKVYVVQNGALQTLPDGFILLAPTRLWPLIQTPLFSWQGKLRMALEPFIPRRKEKGDESLASLVRRRFGQEVLERVAQPLIGGIYAADPEDLSIAATMPRFLEMERRRGSIIRAMLQERRRRSKSAEAGSGARWSLFVTFLGGMEELVETLAGRLPAEDIHLGAQVQGLEWNPAKKSWTILAARAKPFSADGVILATPAYASAEFLSTLSPEIAAELKATPYSSTATVNLAYRKEDIPPVEGFGLVAPAVEGRKIIACTFSSLKYAGRAPEGHLLLRAFVGGALNPDLFALDDRAMERAVRAELAALLGIKAEPLFCRIYRHPRSMPQYRVGHLERMERIETGLKKFPGLALAGNAYLGVGISDCVRSGEEAAEKVLAQIQ